MPTRFSIRLFRPADMPALLEIEHASFKRDVYDRNLFADFYHKCGELFLVAEGDGRIWGYMVTCTRPREGTLRAHLISLAVAPERRGSGVASALMDSTLRRLRRRGVKRFSLMVKVTNQAALALYRRYGFLQLRIARKYYADGSDAWLMVRDLA